MEKVSIKTFDPIKPRFVEISNEKTFAKEASFALQIWNGSDYLQKCTRESLIQAVMNVAQTSLTLNPISKLAYLIPRRQGGNLVCCLDPSYQGLVKLLTDTGSINNIYAHTIHEHDEFNYSLGLNPELDHRPKLGKRGEAIGVYAVAILHDGSKQIEVMSCEDVNFIRDRSESYIAYKAGKIKSCIWIDHYDEMCRKTVIKRISKYLPKTDQWDKIEQAINLDNQDFSINDNQKNEIERLLETSSFSPEKQDFILGSINSLSYKDACDIIDDLYENQTSAIASGRNYNQTEILKELDKHC